jgi:hypothetical protein
MEIIEKNNFEYMGFIFEIIKIKDKCTLKIRVPIKLKDFISSIDSKFLLTYGDEYFLSEEFFRRSSAELFPHRTNVENMKKYIILLFENYLDKK